MKKDPKILLLTGSYGNGHLRVSTTLKEAFLKLGCKQIMESDLYLDAHPLITKASKYLYIKSFTYGHWLYGMLYYGGNRSEKYFQSYFMNNYGMRKLMYLVKTLKPDIIVNTFPMLVVPEFRKKTGWKIPVVNVLTDYGLHKNWLHTEVDKYYVATEQLKFEIMEKGIPCNKIKVTGIPIDPNFEGNDDKELLYEAYRLDLNKPVILIAAGAYGVLKDIEETINSLLYESNNQIIVVCGKNIGLRKKLTEKFEEGKNVRILGYTNRMYDLMKMATVMVTKPGGITLSEALAVQVPLLLYRSVPGQERENSLFFVRNGAAIIVEDHDDLMENINNVIQNEKIQRNMKRDMKKLHNANAAEVICKDIISLLQSEKNKLNRKII